MTVRERLMSFAAEGRLPREQAERLADVHDGRVFSVHPELRAALYLGVLALAAGVGLTVKRYFADLGDAAVIGGLTAGCAAALAYSFRQGAPFSRGETPPPAIAFPYVLLLACLLFSLDLAYIETQFRLFDERWKQHLAIGAALFFGLAYRFDNKIVLGLAISAAAGWLGLTLKDLNFTSTEHYRVTAVGFGLFLAAAGGTLARTGLKAHFAQVYYTFAGHVFFLAATSGVLRHGFESPYPLLLAAACGVAGGYAARARRFEYLLYAMLYGYVGFTSLALRKIDFPGFVLLYAALSPLCLAGAIYFAARKFKGDS